MKNFTSRIQVSVMELVWFIYFVSTYTLNEIFRYNHYIMTIFILLATIFVVNKRVVISIPKKTIGILQYLVIFTAFLCLSILWASGYISTQKSILVSMIEIVIVIMCALSSIKTKAQLVKFIQIFIWSTFVLAIVYYIVSPLNTWGTTSMGSALNIWRNSAGYYFVFSAIFALYLYYIDVKKKGLPLLAAFLIVAAVGTGSRKAIFQIALALFLFVILQKGIWKKVKYSMLAILIVVVIVSIGIQIPMIQEIYFGRLLAIFQGMSGEDSSTIVRTLMQQYALNLFLEHPLVGAGLDGFRIWMGNQYIFLKKYSMEATYSHSNYTEVLANGGLVGFILYYFYPIKTVFTKLKNTTNTFSKLGKITIVSFLILDFGTVSYYSKFCILILFIGIMCVKLGEE